MKSSAELHIARAHIVLEQLPPSAEIIRERHSAWILHRRRCILQWVCSDPLWISDRLVDGREAGDLSESGRQIAPRKVVRRHLDILAGGLLRVVEDVAREMAEV